MDLETWGIRPSSVITSVALVEFDPFGEGIGRTFHQGINPKSCQRYGLRIDADTMQWWLGKDRAVARDAMADLSKVDLDEALIGVDNWLVGLGCEQHELRIWGDGATFDNVLLRCAFEATGFDVPWTYKGDRCYRTLKNMGGGVTGTRHTGGVAHDALSDAIQQTMDMQAIVAHLGLKVL